MIYAIGDSFTYGDELDSQEQAWPAVLSKLLDRPVTNWGKSAAGNTRCVKRAIDAVLDSAEMIIVGWTDPIRHEFADETGIYDIWAGRNFRAFQKDNTHRIDLIKYLTAYDVPEYYYAQWLRQIILVQSLCKLHNLPCVMFIACAANHNHDNFATNWPKLVDAIDQTQFVGGMDTNVQIWTYGLPKGPNNHTLELGHKLIAEKIYEHIRN